ncbi:hypothetical protein [Thalassobaculum sp.]|uniref:hypothetical protein n=1 Tax=Thalassobaculum sp. TaxID=2022740 RepID=UPI0032F02810
MAIGSASAILGWDNRVDDATITVGSSPERASALQDRSLGEAWESDGTDPADTWIEFAFDKPTSARLLSLHGCNVTVQSQYQVRVWEDAGKTDQVYDSAVTDVCPPLIPMAARDWSRPALWTGKPTSREWRRRPRQIIHPLPAVRRGRVWRIDVLDDLNPDATIRVARPFLGDALQVANTIDLGSELSFRTFAQVQEGPSGQREGSESRPARSTRFSLNWLNEAERGLVIDLLTTMGETGEVVWIPHPDDGPKLQRESYLGYLRSRSVRRVRNATETSGLSAEIRELV